MIILILNSIAAGWCIFAIIAGWRTGVAIVLLVLNLVCIADSVREIKRENHT